MEDYYGYRVAGRVMFDGHSILVIEGSTDSFWCCLASSDIPGYNLWLGNNSPYGKEWNDYINYLIIKEDTYLFPSVQSIHKCIANGSARLRESWR